MRDFILTVGFIQEALPIRNFIFGKLSEEGRSSNGNPYSTVYADGLSWRIIKILIIIGSIRQLSFGGWADLGETSNCQVAEFYLSGING